MESDWQGEALVQGEDVELFHGELDGETPLGHDEPMASSWSHLTSLETGFLVGLLVGEGHFGGDGRKPQVTLRMHVRHEKLFHWLVGACPGSRLYGPYSHGGRNYFQWMVRGEPLRDGLLPILESCAPLFDDHVSERLQRMCETYALPWLPASS